MLGPRGRQNLKNVKVIEGKENRQKRGDFRAQLFKNVLDLAETLVID